MGFCNASVFQEFPEPVGTVYFKIQACRPAIPQIGMGIKKINFITPMLSGYTVRQGVTVRNIYFCSIYKYEMAAYLIPEPICFIGEPKRTLDILSPRLCQNISLIPKVNHIIGVFKIRTPVFLLCINKIIPINR